MNNVLIVLIIFACMLQGAEAVFLLPVLRELGLSWNPYDYEGNLIHQARNEDLDPIPPGLVGCINRVALLAAAEVLKVPLLIEYVSALVHEASFMALVKPDLKKLISDPKARGRASNFAMYACLGAYAGWGLLEDVTGTHMTIYCFATFFTVMKSNGKLRAIFDCRALNAVCARPANIRLMPVTEAMQEAAKLRVRYVVASDWQHFFYELGIPKNVCNLFGVRCRGFMWLIRACAMGFSFSPAFSMAATLICILHAEPGADRLGIRVSEIRHLTYIPGSINLYDKKGKKCGFIVIYYDDIGIFCRDKKMAQDWAKRLQANATKFGFRTKTMEFGSLGKVEDLIHPVSGPMDEKGTPLRNITIDGFLTFLGVELHVAHDGGAFKWRHSPKKLLKWIEVFKSEPTTPRAVAKIVGILMWDTMINLKPLSEIGAEIEALRQLALANLSKEAWDVPLHGTLAECLLGPALKLHAARLVHNDWISDEDTRAARTVYLASDGTETSIAGVLLNDSGAIDSFGKEMAKTHIFVKEVLAGYMTLVWAHDILGTTEWTEYRLAVDSTSAGAALGRCYSSNPKINEMLVNMWNFMKEKKIKLRIVDIDTTWNVADNPSRGKKTSHELAMKTMEVLKGAPSRRDGVPQKERPSGYLPSIARYDVPEEYSDDPLALLHNINKHLVNRVLETDFQEPEEDEHVLPVIKRPREVNA